ncbi:MULTISPECIES: hypothetical protein [Thalassotalea]|uniref:hypothetical protein n=1 Tax=Thalassotalea TaxID=1518149 RepID=UPI0011150E78|nr:MULTISPECIES: hypothetical protein [Thalassotalea]
MKLSIIHKLGLLITITLTGCSTQVTPLFAQLDKETSDYCIKFNGVNESGKKVIINRYRIKSVETDSSGKQVEIRKIVDCQA